MTRLIQKGTMNRQLRVCRRLSGCLARVHPAEVQSLRPAVSSAWTSTFESGDTMKAALYLAIALEQDASGRSQL